MDQSFQWALPARFSPQVRCWGDECALFDAESGDTHLIDVVASTILTELSSGPLATSDIFARLAEGLAAEIQVAAQHHLLGLLSSLESKSLVRRVVT